MFWRLVQAQWAAKSELDAHYTLADLASANDMLSARLEAEAALRARQRAKAKG